MTKAVQADPSASRVYGHCRTCNGLGVYFDVQRRLYYYLNGELHSVHPADFMADSSLNPNPEVSVTSTAPMKQGRVIQRITNAGYYYRVGDVESGLCSMQDEQDGEFDVRLTKQLGVD